MTNMNLGRHELLQWINQIVQSQYPSIQSLADGVAYCQIFQAIHPGSINTSRMTFITKLPIDCLKNLKILQSSLKNMKITMTSSIQKMANGRFQDNILFVQWLYAHALKYGRQNLQNYNAFQRRTQILQKQGKRWNQVNMHLLPNQVYKHYEDQQYQTQTQQQHNNYQRNNNNNIRNRNTYQGQNEYENQNNYNYNSNYNNNNKHKQQQNREVEQKIQQIGNYVASLQSDLKQKMQSNWKTMHIVGRYIQQRNTLYGLLQQIEKIALNCGDSPVQKQILRILNQKPDQYKDILR